VFTLIIESVNELQCVNKFTHYHLESWSPFSFVAPSDKYNSGISTQLLGWFQAQQLSENRDAWRKLMVACVDSQPPHSREKGKRVNCIHLQEQESRAIAEPRYASVNFDSYRTLQ